MSYPVRRDWSRSWPTPRWDPLAEFEAMRDRMNRLFGEVAGGGPGRMATPDVECDESADAWLVEARLPGFAPDDVSVELVERELSIIARRESEDAPQPGGRTMRRGDFSYHVTLPGEVDASGVEAQMDNGVLQVKLPKSPAAKPHRIEVGAGRQLTGAAAKSGGGGTQAGEAGEQASGAGGQSGGGGTQPGRDAQYGREPQYGRERSGGESGRATGVAEAPQRSQATPPPPGAAPGPSGMPSGQSGGQQQPTGTTYQGGSQQRGGQQGGSQQGGGRQ